MFFVGPDGEVVPPCEVPAGARLFTGGSCLFPHLGHRSRAGCSVAQADEDGNLARGLRCAIPRNMEQSSGTSEHCAIMIRKGFAPCRRPPL